MKQVPLSEVAEFINGRAFKPEDWQTEGLPIIRIQNLTGSTDTVNYYSGKVEPRYLVRNDDILISWSASLGVYKWQGGDAILNQHIFKVELKEKLIDKEYFYYVAQNALVEMESHVHGATMQHITRDPFLAIEIPLPPLTEQKRIASLLARADRLRQLRRTAHDLGDELLQSVFLETFGDPVKDSHKWQVESLIDIINPDRPITYGILMPGENLPNGVPYVRVVDIWDGKIYIPNVRRTSAEIDKQYKRSRLLPEDLLLTIRGQVGRLAIVPPELKGANITQDTARLDPIRSMCNVYYLFGCMLMPSFQNLMQTLTRGVAVTGINLGDVKELPIPLPPISLQEVSLPQFARHN